MVMLKVVGQQACFLPKIFVISDDDQEEETIGVWCKLFRHQTSKSPPEWKERDTGGIKILRNKQKKAARQLSGRAAGGLCQLPGVTIGGTAGSSGGAWWGSCAGQRRCCWGSHSCMLSFSQSYTIRSLKTSLSTLYSPTTSLPLHLLLSSPTLRTMPPACHLPWSSRLVASRTSHLLAKFDAWGQGEYAPVVVDVALGCTGVQQPAVCTHTHIHTQADIFGGRKCCVL
ncbi:uncharacterized protein LOC135093456 [Scylla paramamosain]|uniref:uncharacterized protein LOC135093456 n=1 Tax=Scylla paramamosain TaxID=85552 RepID=UPI00308396BF